MTDSSLSGIYAAYHGKVLTYLTARTANPQDAEDLCEEVFLKIGQALGRYDPEKPSLSTWIYQIIRFTLIDHLRTRHPCEPLNESLLAADDLEALVLRKETLVQLASALASLDQKLRDVIVLRYYKGCTLTEIARLTGRSYGMVKVCHKKSLDRLRAELQPKDVDV